jgi:uncharacterized protein YjbI with pentapeptide repeats
VDLTDAILTNVGLSGADLTSATLRGAILDAATLIDTIMPNGERYTDNMDLSQFLTP